MIVVRGTAWIQFDCFFKGVERLRQRLRRELVPQEPSAQVGFKRARIVRASFTKPPAAGVSELREERLSNFL